MEKIIAEKAISGFLKIKNKDNPIITRTDNKNLEENKVFISFKSFFKLLLKTKLFIPPSIINAAQSTMETI